MTKKRYVIEITCKKKNEQRKNCGNPEERNIYMKLPDMYTCILNYIFFFIEKH